jgi:ADP-ribose pyrophosphatase YjhB (NUDIX family)
MSYDLFQLGVKAVVCNSNNKILLLQVNTKNFSGTHEPYWDLPGGRKEKNETVIKTLRRELYEETGIEEIGTQESIGSCIANIRIPTDEGDVGLLLFVYRVQVYNTSEVHIGTEHQQYEWYTIEEACHVLRKNIRKNF